MRLSGAKSDSDEQKGKETTESCGERVTSRAVPQPQGQRPAENYPVKLLMYFWATSHYQTSRAGCRGLLRLLLLNFFLNLRYHFKSDFAHLPLESQQALSQCLHMQQGSPGTCVWQQCAVEWVEISAFKQNIQKMSASTLLKWKICNVSSFMTVKVWDAGWTDITSAKRTWDFINTVIENNRFIVKTRTLISIMQIIVCGPWFAPNDRQLCGWGAGFVRMRYFLWV